MTDNFFVCFLKPPGSESDWQVRMHGAFTIASSTLRFEEKDQSYHHEMWVHISHVKAHVVDHGSQRRPNLKERNATIRCVTVHPCDFCFQKHHVERLQHLFVKFIFSDRMSRHFLWPVVFTSFRCISCHFCMSHCTCSIVKNILRSFMSLRKRGHKGSFLDFCDQFMLTATRRLSLQAKPGEISWWPNCSGKAAPRLSVRHCDPFFAWGSVARVFCDKSSQNNEFLAANRQWCEISQKRMCRQCCRFWVQTVSFQIKPHARYGPAFHSTQILCLHDDDVLQVLRNAKTAHFAICFARCFSVVSCFRPRFSNLFRHLVQSMLIFVQWKILVGHGCLGHVVHFHFPGLR